MVAVARVVRMPPFYIACLVAGLRSDRFTVVNLKRSEALGDPLQTPWDVKSGHSARQCSADVGRNRVEAGSIQRLPDRGKRSVPMVRGCMAAGVAALYNSIIGFPQ